ncbi:hypothetical protein F6P79_07315 [Streptococcus suis]|uniref:reverse transcriptase domain-containing protein n=2 Tax=Streptococcus suis TaxID=1307 RepID=UPI001EE8CF7D|nr:reverse transcriptase domain-containing protein [Streptococcus suis]MBS8086349.1 hypothetical protein [Streptococcus suis]MCO8184796.1 reverse transcriptase domain-containing protein [Streptococcus suis]MCO8216362.1 reverse transcriptase domain-containing protein [Streptococcus suis]HEM3475030.1 hypothetical protein [Streptococcus suis]HEM3497011.1 hypothetical protein [Streptococcus suis]
MTEEINKQISEKLFEFFVANPNVIAMQMPDGNYIPQVIKYDSSLFYQMLRKGSSLAVYQQKSYSSKIKWLCFDFDIRKGKEIEGNIEELVQNFVYPLISHLSKMKLNYLVEFSGRRGVHIWIIFEKFFEKHLGYDLMEKILQEVAFKEPLDEKYGLDRFPATRLGKNKYGKAVKLPLSVHKKTGAQSYFFDGVTLEITKQLDLGRQLEYLIGYSPNDIAIFDTFDLEKVVDNRLKYRKQEYKGVSIDFETLILKTSDSIVFSKLWSRVKRSELTYMDRLVLVGAFSHFDKELLFHIFSSQLNFDAERTRKNIEKLGKNLYPLTMAYLYDIYQEELEDFINPNETILEYISGRMGIQLIESIEYPNNITQKILEKEKKYLVYNDEIIEPKLFFELNSLFEIDVKNIESRARDIIDGKENYKNLEIEPYYLFLRKEEKEGFEKIRRLVSLSTFDRLLTTRLIVEFSQLIGRRYNSYSYNLNLFSGDNLFFPFFSSWKKFINDIEIYLKFDIFDDYGIIKLDISSFYDSIYFHSIYSQMKKTIEYRSSRHSEKLNNILNYLSKYNDKLMIDITGNIKGVPQGPAYSRVLAEFFLSTVLEEFSEEYRKKNSKVNFKIYRYVDDMYIIYQNLQDGDMFLEALTEHLSKVGLSINQEKTKNFGKIGNLSDSEKKDFFEESYLSYLIQDFEDLTYLSDEEHQEIYSFFEKYLERNGKWNIKDANFLLGNYIDETLLEFYISKYYHFILTSKYGRGSIFTKFYKYVFKKSDLVKKFFMNRDYESVPKDSLNFESLISTLFFEIDFVKEVLMNDSLIEECLQYLQSNVNVESNAFKTINVLKERVINDDTGY